jgi:soluble lytic murein transglycosylase-like protein
MATVVPLRPRALAAALAALACLSVGAAARASTVTVAPGDTLGAIATRAGVSVSALAAANGLTDPNLLVAGRVLVVPGVAAAPPPTARSSYRVRPGDTLDGIAGRAGTSVGVLVRLNRLADPNRLAAGRVLRLPAPQAAPAAPTDPALVRGLIAEHAGRYGLDPALVRALAWQESGWSQAARSHVGAIGVMQLMPGTARWVGPALVGRALDPTRVQDNVQGGVAYLAWLVRRTGSVRAAVAAYYQGPRSLRRRGPLPETRRYVANVLALVGRV